MQPNLLRLASRRPKSEMFVNAGEWPTVKKLLPEFSESGIEEIISIIRNIEKHRLCGHLSISFEPDRVVFTFYKAEATDQ